MLLLYALARPIASTLSVTSSNNTSAFDPITGECIDINECRTTTSILWSCLSVIFICTWVAIHPNIPTVDTHWAVVIYQNIELMVVAILVPEFMILWAMRQREHAKAIGDKFKNYGWGMSHGFFVIMGGFALFDGHKFCGYLWDRDRDYDGLLRPYEGAAEKYFERIKTYHEKHQDHCLEDIDNHSDEKTLESYTSTDTALESDTEPLSRSSDSEPATILEFLISRGYITLTKDEIKDKGHADVITKSIAIIQTTWFILQVIARAVEGLAITELEIITVGFAILNFGTYFLWWNKPLRVRYHVRVYWRQQAGKSSSSEEEEDWIRSLGRAISVVVGYIYDGDKPRGIMDWIAKLTLLPLRIPLHILIVCFRILQDEDDCDLSIPISSRLDNDSARLYITVYGIAALFGAIHCIPWGFQFPTETEQLLWRTSAVAVAAAPIAMGLLHGYAMTLGTSTPRWLDLALILGLSIPYTAFRIILVVIAFTSLRDLHPSAYQTVQWTSFIPHIG